jgi:hypothetical protein
LHLDLDLNIELGQELVGSLVDGVFGLADNPLNYVTGLLGGLLSNSGSQSAQVAIVGIRELQHNRVMVSLQLQDSVPGGVSLEVNVDLLNVLGIVAHVNTQQVVFSGIRGQTINVVVDVSSAIDSIDGNIAAQVSISNIRLNLAIDVDIVVDLAGLNNLLDEIVHILHLHEVVNNLLTRSETIPSLPMSSSISINQPVLDGQTLNVFVSLNSNVELIQELNVDLSVLLFSNTMVKLDRVIPIHFSGHAGEVVRASIDLSGLNIDGNIMALLDLSTDPQVNLTLADNQLFSLMNGDVLKL